MQTGTFSRDHGATPKLAPQEESGGRERESLEPQDNESLYQQLVQQIPGYAWQKRDPNTPENMDSIHIPRPKDKIHFKRRGMQKVKGLGSVNVSMKHPQFYIEPIRRWFNKLS